MQILSEDKMKICTEAGIKCKIKEAEAKKQMQKVKEAEAKKQMQKVKEAEPKKQLQKVKEAE